MPDWCPKCGAMLPAGLEKCPACGKRLKKQTGEELNSQDIASLSLYVIGLAIIPILLALGIGLICILFLR